jgi:hypothetical protein
MQINVTAMESNMEVPQKNLKIELSYNPGVPLLGLYLKEGTPGYDRTTCIAMFIATQFIKAKLWKQPRCSTTDKH